MGIVNMKKLRLWAVKSQRDAIVRDLMLLSCVQVKEPDSADPDLAALSRESCGQVGYQVQHARLLAAVKLLDQYAPVKSPLLAARPEVTNGELLDEAKLAERVALAEQLEGWNDQIRRLNVLEARLKASQEALLPWEPLDLPLDVRETHSCVVTLGTAPASVPEAALHSAVADVTDAVELIFVSVDEHQRCLELICRKEDYNALLEAIRPLRFAPVAPLAPAGTVKENIKEARIRIAACEGEKAELAARIAAESPRRMELKLALDAITAKIARAEAAEKMLYTESTILLTGWLEAPLERKLAETMAKYDCAWETEDPLPDEYMDVPVKLKNNKLTDSLNMVTEMYSLPAYGGVDPNPLIAPFFILFYGLMMSDMGYGVLMILISLLVKRVRPKGTMKHLFDLMFWCGITTTVMGLLTGSCFGDTLYQFMRMVNPDTSFTGLWHVYDPLNDTIYVLIGALVLGCIQEITGMCVDLWMKARAGRLWDGILDNAPWWVLFAGIAVSALTGSSWLLLAGGVLLVCTQGRAKPTLPGKLLGGVASLYNITGFLSDILSYSRIMALMLAGSVISQVFNTLAAMPGTGWAGNTGRLIVGILCFIIIWAFGNTLNFGLNLLSCYVHDLRLQCLEYFGRFYQDGGRPFRPLCINPKYVDISKEEN